jgi:hypothetical protein
MAKSTKKRKKAKKNNKAFQINKKGISELESNALSQEEDSDSDEEEDYNPSAFVKNTVPNSFKPVESICVEDNWDEDW